MESLGEGVLSLGQRRGSRISSQGLDGEIFRELAEYPGGACLEPQLHWGLRRPGPRVWEAWSCSAPWPVSLLPCLVQSLAAGH